MLHLGGVRAGDEGGAGSDEFFHRVDRPVDRPGGIGLGFVADSGSGRRLLLRQPIDVIVHDDVSEIDVLAGAVLEMVAADRKPVAIAAENEDMEVGTGEAYARRQWQSAPVNEMQTVRIDEVGKAGRTADSRDGDDFS